MRNRITDYDRGYVLVIDDDALVVRTVRKALEKQGFFVDTADSGEEGIRKAKTGFFHLVLCDIRMPGLDGLMTVQRIQGLQLKAGIGKSGFIIITAYDTDEHRERACQLGVTDFLRKPFDLATFLDVVEHNIKPLVKQTPCNEVARLNQRLGRLLASLHEDQPPVQ